MTDDAAKPADGAPKPPAPIPPKVTTSPNETLGAAPPVTPPKPAVTPASPGTVGTTSVPGGAPVGTGAPAPVPPRTSPPAADAKKPANSPATPPAPSPATLSPATPPAARSAPPPAPGATPKTGGSRALAVLLALVCVLAVVGAGYFYFLSRTAAIGLAARLDDLEQSVAALEQRAEPADKAPATGQAAVPPDLQALTDRVAALEQKPAAAAPEPDLQPLADRIAALEQKIAALPAAAPPAPVDLQPLTDRVAALEQKPAPAPPAPVDLAPLEGRLTALETRPPAPAPLDAGAQAVIAGLAGRIDQLAARQDQLGTRQQSDVAKLGEQIAGQDSRMAAQDGAIASAAKAGPAVDALSQRATRLAALQAASAALTAGRPLGTVPGAPPALAQFADKPPPSEASLRLSFDAAAQAAREAGQPQPADAPFLQRTLARLQSSVVVRQGDRVILGDAINGVLAHAQAQLDAGDIAGALAALDQLAGPAAAAMAPWRQQAQALLDARSALLTLARG